MEPQNINYLREVLGIESVFFDQKTSKVIDVLFVSEVSNPAQKDLLDKMIKAMGLLPHSYQISSSISDTQAKVIVVFSAVKNTVPIENTKIIHTHGLNDLLAKPELKKETWTHLKEVIEFLKK